MIIEKNKEKYSLLFTKEEYIKSCEIWNKYYKDDEYDIEELKTLEDVILISKEDVFEYGGGLMFEEDFWEYIRENISEEEDEKESFTKEVKI